MANADLRPNAQLVQCLHHHAYYLSELHQTNQVLRHQSDELAGVESILTQRTERGLQRREKKMLQWSRALLKRSIGQLYLRRSWLIECLDQNLTLQALCTHQHLSMTLPVQAFSLPLMSSD